MNQGTRKEEVPMHGFVGPDDGPEETVVNTKREARVPAPLDVETVRAAKVFENPCPECGHDSLHGADAILDETTSGHEPTERLRVAFESRFDDQWPEWMDAAWHEAVDEVSNQPSTEPAQGGTE